MSSTTIADELSRVFGKSSIPALNKIGSHFTKLLDYILLKIYDFDWFLQNPNFCVNYYKVLTYCADVKFGIERAFLISKQDAGPGPLLGIPSRFWATITTKSNLEDEDVSTVADIIADMKEINKITDRLVRAYNNNEDKAAALTAFTQGMKSDITDVYDQRHNDAKRRTAFRYLKSSIIHAFLITSAYTYNNENTVLLMKKNDDDLSSATSAITEIASFYCAETKLSMDELGRQITAQDGQKAFAHFYDPSHVTTHRQITTPPKDPPVHLDPKHEQRGGAGKKPWDTTKPTTQGDCFKCRRFLAKIVNKDGQQKLDQNYVNHIKYRMKNHKHAECHRIGVKDGKIIAYTNEFPDRCNKKTVDEIKIEDWNN
jgi:hypothetical protein